MLSVCLEIKTTCSSCGNPLPVNALVSRIHCSSCQADSDFSNELWSESILESTLKEGITFAENEARQETVMTGQYNFQILYGRQNPRCANCKTPLDENLFEAYTSAGKAVCTKCNSEVSFRKIPDELKTIFQTVNYIAGEDADQIPGGQSKNVEQNRSKPLLFTCPSCAGNLEIDGKERTITCKFCGSEIYLPDDLWLRMHPVKTVGRWYLIFDEKALQEMFPDWYYLSDVTIDSDGNLYVISAVDSKDFTKAWSFDKDLKVRWVKKLPGYSYEYTKLAVSPKKDLYVVDKEKHSLLVLSTSDGSTIRIVDGKQPTEEEPEPFNMMDCDEFEVDSDGSLIILKNNKILRFSAEGEKLPTWYGGEDHGLFGKIAQVFSGNDDYSDLNVN